MKETLVYAAGSTKACQYASDFLSSSGIDTIDHPTPEVTHLLLDVPSFTDDGTLRGGGDFSELLRRLPKEITIVGGNLNHPALINHTIVDLLRDPEYLARNASITSECALQVAAMAMDSTFADSPILILGWGRIGKCLARMLRGMGADVTVAARKEEDRAMLSGLGYTAADITRLASCLPKFSLIFNTVPALILSQEDTTLSKECTLIDLASKPGIEHNTVITARGLPGIYAPRSSGKLIAETVKKLCMEETICR